MRYRLTAVRADGRGFTYGRGDTYELEADIYDAAEADVLSREGISGTLPYARIVKAWAWDKGTWVQLPQCQDCQDEIARTKWAASGQMICWTCCEARQAQRPG